jgi:1-aminocyclopropane-1-carboxylate deaminase
VTVEAEYVLTPIQHIRLLGVEVVVKREDLNHPLVQGNKLRKLKYNLNRAAKQPAAAVLTFGGAWSNHLLATAAACQSMQLRAIGVVRGDELRDNHAIWSDTLYQCQRLGMQLEFVSRTEYREKEHGPTVSRLMEEHPSLLVIPEGGSNELAVRGMAELVPEILNQGIRPTHVLCPVGTGGTVAGLIHGVGLSGLDCQVIGVAVLKGLQAVNQQIAHWLSGLPAADNWLINHDHHCGGYAKSTPELVRFALAFTQQHGIALDKVYNSKSFYALAQLIKAGQITAQDRPLIVHTGGLQGGTF